MVGSRAVATVGINGTQVRLIVDSGAFYSSITHAAAQQLHLKEVPLPSGMRLEGLTGEHDGSLTTVERMQFLGGELPNVDFLVTGNDEGGTLGLLGRNLLGVSDVEYDLAHGAIRLMFPNEDCDKMGMAYWAGDKPASVLELLKDDRSATRAIAAVGKLNGEKLRVLFDTGASSLVSLRAARRAGLKDADLTPAGKVAGMGTDLADMWTSQFTRFELADEAVSNVRLRVVDFDLEKVDMLLGIDFFLSHRIYVSKKQRRMYFTYNGGPVFSMAAAAMPRVVPSSADAASAPEPDEQPQDASGFARRGAASAARRDYRGALADLDRACELAPDNAEYFVRRGVVHEALKQPQLALQNFDTALKLDPAQAEALLHRAWLRLGMRSRDGALQDLQALDKALAPQAHHRLDVARLYLRLELPERAIAQWNLWVPAHANDVELGEILNERCWTRTMLNVELDQALEDCNKAVDSDSKNASFLDSRAWVHLRRGDPLRAVADFDRSLKLKPATVWSLYGRGLARGQSGSGEQGQADIEAARKLRPSIDDEVRRRGFAVAPGATTP